LAGGAAFSESPPLPPSNSKEPFVQESIPKPGYVRCGVLFLGVDWQFEVIHEEQKLLVVTIATQDGPIDIGLKREDAEALLQRLELFLKDRPTGLTN
jgi:hypothetical protein